MSATRVVIFAKAPVPGQVKTRLIPALGAVGAAGLARYLLNRTLDKALAAAIGPVELCMSPGADGPEWDRIDLPLGVLTSEQGEGDLGARMARAARRVLASGERVLLIGTDCPALFERHLCAAAKALDDHDAVLHPALDGGYVLLGLRAFHPWLFDDMPWSTRTVAGLTLARLRTLDWRVRLGETLPDIDEPADLAHLSAELGIAPFCPLPEVQP